MQYNKTSQDWFVVLFWYQIKSSRCFNQAHSNLLFEKKILDGKRTKWTTEGKNALLSEIKTPSSDAKRKSAESLKNEVFSKTSTTDQQSVELTNCIGHQ